MQLNASAHAKSVPAGRETANPSDFGRGCPV
jgi:hypothetical protein